MTIKKLTQEIETLCGTLGKDMTKTSDYNFWLENKDKKVFIQALLMLTDKYIHETKGGNTKWDQKSSMQDSLSFLH